MSAAPVRASYCRAPVLAIAAACLAWASVQVNLERACTVGDTPYLHICPSFIPGSAQHLAALRARLERNPGATPAYIELAQYGPAINRAAATRAAASLAPGEPAVLGLQAAGALLAQDWSDAISPLIRLVQYRRSDEAALAIARLIAMGRSELLAPHLAQVGQWLPRVLNQMGIAGLPLSAAQPLVVKALASGALDAQAVMPYIRNLKARAAWTDAYSLWIAVQGGRAPVLYNGNFDQPLRSDGFDWEIPADQPFARAGALVERRPAGASGAVLRVQLTGRPLPAALVRQYLFLAPGRYRIAGEFAPLHLRMDQGLAWSVRCTASSVQAGASRPLSEEAEQRGWRHFDFSVVVPAACGPVASLQLEPASVVDREAGGRGSVEFENLRLERLLD